MDDFKLNYSYGSKGIRGLKGDPGSLGVIGNYGDYGPKGEPGIKGIKGCVGTNGENGIKGEEGNMGPKGLVGIPTPGIKGIKGEKGVHITEQIALANSTILQYSDGTVFEFINNTLKGTQGDKGDTGDTGDDGSNGSKGDDGSNGSKGEKGIKGEVGESIITLTENYINSNYSINQLFTNTTDNFEVNLKGEQGILGNIGDNGNLIEANVNKYHFGFKINGNSAVIFNASQINDNEYYMPVYEERFIHSNNSGTITNSYFDMREDTRYVSANYYFNKFLDNKIVGLFDNNTNLGNILAGSLDSISPINTIFYNLLPFNEHFSRGLDAISNGIQKPYIINKITKIEGITINFHTIIKDTANGFEFINNEYILTNQAKPTDNSKFYGIAEINSFRFYIPIKIFIRLEEHVIIGDKELTTCRYIDNGIINTQDVKIDRLCPSNTLLKYIDWFVVENNEYLSLENLVWNIHNTTNNTNTKYSIRYKFSLPSDIKVGNIINNFTIIDKSNSVSIGNGVNISEFNQINPNLPFINTVSEINSYNNLPTIDKDIYLPQVISAIIPINELSCNIKTSTI